MSEQIDPLGKVTEDKDLLGKIRNFLGGFLGYVDRDRRRSLGYWPILGRIEACHHPLRWPSEQKAQDHADDDKQGMGEWAR